MIEIEDERPGLPPYSGRDGVCPKCGCRCAETKWLVKPSDSLTRMGLQSFTSDPWYVGYMTGGDLLTVARTGGYWSAIPADWWPDEWLGRHCLICHHRWDEAVVDAIALEHPKDDAKLVSILRAVNDAISRGDMTDTRTAWCQAYVPLLLRGIDLGSST